MLGINEKNRLILSELDRKEKGPFTIKEATSVLNLAERKTARILAHLARKGWLSRVKQGVYLSVPLGAVNPKEFKTNPWVTANHVFSPCYIGGWSAAEHWHLTEQVFSSVVVFTSKKTRSSTVGIKGTAFIIRNADKSVFESGVVVWLENEKVIVTNPARTVADILDDPAIGGGIRNCAEILNNYFTSEYKDEKKLLSAIKALNNKTIYKRLGYLLEKTGIDMLKVLSECKSNISTGFTYLDPSIKLKGRINTKWNLRINAEIKNDNTE